MAQDDGERALKAAMKFFKEPNPNRLEKYH